jgi:hypothetical protein
MAAGDPRERQDGLGWVSRAIFPDDRLRLEFASAARDSAPPAGWRVSGRYAAVPSLARPRFLLPLVSRRVAAASMLAYNALRPAKVRAGRAAVGVLARLGVFDLIGVPVLTVLAPAGVEGADLLLTEHLATVLGNGPLHAGIGIRPPDPHHKPTLQLFDDLGRPRGYAKIGWNEATRSLVRAEATALRELPRGGGDFPDAPRLMFAGAWHDREIAVVEPMPPGVRRIRRPQVPRLAAMLAVARRGGPATPRRPLRASPYLAALRARAAGADEAIRTAIDGFATRYGELLLELGDWHGDWVPWNLGRHRGRLLAWDWENRASGVPVGFDLAHQAFQIALSTHRLPAAGAADAMVAALERYGSGLGLDAEHRRLVANGYLIELWLRTHELAAGGAGWNRKLHPALLDVLGAWR